MSSTVGQLLADIRLERLDRIEELVDERLDQFVGPLSVDDARREEVVAERVGVLVVPARAECLAGVVEAVHAATDRVVEGEQVAVAPVEMFDAELEIVERRPFVLVRSLLIVHTVPIAESDQNLWRGRRNANRFLRATLRTAMTASGDWTAERMGDLSDRTVVVTGANSGLGFEAAKAFASHGADVVLACRSVERGVDAGERIREVAPATRLTVIELDLADLASIRAFATSFADTHDELHVLCNNAGVMAIPRSETADGFETQFGVNHLGHFALTGLLLDELRDTDGETRVVTQSSALHENGGIDFTNLQSEQPYDKWAAYGQSKLANVLFAYELQRSLRATGVESVSSVACHPGYADTNLQKRGPEQAGSTLRLLGMKAANAVIGQDAATGALPLLYAATADDVDGGEYVGPGGFGNMRGRPETQRSSERSYDETTAGRLWDVSEELTGVRYGLDSN